MKTPLRYQITEYDCGSTSIINALSYLFDSSEIPVYFLKQIYDICLDECDEDGIIGDNGTSNEAMKFLADWFNAYREKTNFPIYCSYLENDDVTFINDSKLLNLLKDENTVIIIRCKLEYDHFILLTNADENYIYAFDPYFENICNDEKIIKTDDIKANRKIPIDFMETTKGKYYSINDIEKIAIVFSNK